MLKRISQILSRIPHTAYRLAKFCVRAAAVLLISLAAAFALVDLSLPIGKQLTQLADDAQVYNLTIQNIYGPVLLVLDNVMVARVRHEADGSLCFIDMRNGLSGCIKTQNYFLRPINVR